MAKRADRVFAFSVFTFRQETGELIRRGKCLRIPDQATKLLSILLEHPGEMVPREELRAALWPHGEVLDYDRSINRAVSELRSVLRDRPTNPTEFIETLPKRGYRFTAPVRELAEPELPLTPADTPEISADIHKDDPPASAPSSTGVDSGVPPNPPAPVGAQAAPGPRRRRRTWLSWTSLVVAMAGLGILAGWLYQNRAGVRVPLSLGIAAFETNDPQAQALAESFRLNLADVLSQSPQIETRSVHSFDHIGTDEHAVLDRARQLKVDVLLFGSFTVEGTQCRIHLELVRSRDGIHLASLQYSGTREELALITDRAENDLFERLRLGKKLAQLHPDRPASPAAYAAYLRGRTLLHQWTDDALLQAVTAFREALAYDSSYARAYAGLASTYFVLAQHQPGNTDYLVQVQNAAATAATLDPTLAEAHAMLGQAALQKDWDFPKAETEMHRAVELDPDHAIYRQWLSILYALEGKYDDAFAQIDRAHAADPDWAPLYMTEIFIAGSARRFDRAENAAIKLLQARPNWSIAHEQTAMLYWQEHKQEQAIAEWRRAAELEQNAKRMKLEDEGLAAFRKGGAKAYAHVRLKAIHDGWNSLYPNESFDLAEWNAYAGNYDTALRELQKQVNTHAPAALQIMGNAAYDPLRATPAFQEIIRHSKLPL